MNTQFEPMPPWWTTGIDAWNELQAKVSKEAPTEAEIAEKDNVFTAIQPTANMYKWGEVYTPNTPLLGNRMQGFVGRLKTSQPEWARWMGALNLSNYRGNSEYNRDGYTLMPSYDWRPLNANKNHPDQLQYDEENGLRLLIHFICKVPVSDYNLFTIFGAYTFGLCELKRRPHKETICVIRGGFCERFPLLIFDNYHKEQTVVDVYGKAHTYLVTQRKLNVKETLLRKADGLQNHKMIEEINRRIQVNNNLPKMNAA